MDFLREAFNAPAHQPKWEAELLKALGLDELTFPRCEEIIQTLRPLMGELYLKASDEPTPTPWPKQGQISGESGGNSRVARETSNPRFRLGLNTRDEVFLVEGDNWPIVLGHRHVVREQLVQFVTRLQSNDGFPAEDRAS